MTGIRYLIFIITALTAAMASASDAGMADSMRRYGMVDVGAMDSTIVVDLMYARPDNFTGKIIYDDLRCAFLHPLAADALIKASAELRRLAPELRLKICDAARPMSAQRKMYATVRGTAQAPYVSNPAKGGGLHNYGMAVDVTIVDENGIELPMGSDVDHLGYQSNIDREALLVKRGVITETHRRNRELLRKVMVSAGFRPLRSEWWHFNMCTRATAIRRYRLLDF